ncbi:hypothetical protein LJR129_003078 [Acidovorax sp. LjRoot129]|uniref:hypothetical protein n=1 Tax=Acidovorax sp. LjRoot129 TaxID=3342260 RepID=UPI003ECFD0E4
MSVAIAGLASAAQKHGAIRERIQGVAVLCRLRETKAMREKQSFFATVWRMEVTCAGLRFGMAAPVKRRDEAMQQSVLGTA